MPKFQYIIFDLGGVLIDWNPRYLYNKLLPNEYEVAQFLNNICTYPWNLKQDAGRTLQEATEELLAQFPEQEELIRAYYGRWEEMLGGAIAGTVQIMRDLQEKGYRLYALTNWSRETFPIAQRHFPFLQEFEGVVVSGEEHVRKPDPALYQILFSRYALSPEACLFIDDVPQNIETGEALGMKGIVFKSPIQLRTELEALGIL